MKKRVWGMTAVGIVVTGVCMLAFAAEPLGNMALAKFPVARMIHAKMQRMRKLRQDLHITEQQKQLLAAMVQEHRAEIKAQARELVARRRALREAVLADKIDETAIRTAAGNLSQSIGNAAVLAARIREQAARIMTAEQVEKIRTAISENDKDVDTWLNEMLEKQ